MIAVSAMWWPWYARLTYNVTRQVATEGYVTAAEVVGASTLPHPVPRDPAELRGADRHEDDARPRVRHPARLEPQLPRAGRPAADPGPRLDGRRGRQVPARPVVAGGVPRRSPSWSSCSASTCSATACTTSWTSSDDRRPRRSSRSTARAARSTRLDGSARILNGVRLDGLGRASASRWWANRAAARSLTARADHGPVRGPRHARWTGAIDLRRRRPPASRRPRMATGCAAGGIDDDLPGPGRGAQPGLHDRAIS